MFRPQKNVNVCVGSYKNEFKKEIELVVYNKRYNKSRYTSKYERVMSDVTRSSEYESVERSV